MQHVREASVLRAQEKIEHKKHERRKEELRLKRELKEISTKRQFLQANAEMVEIKAYEEQQTGLQREAATRQAVAIVSEQRNREIFRIEKKNRKLNRKSELDEHRDVIDAFDKHMELARIDDEMFTAEIRTQNKTARELQRGVEANLSATLRRDKPYAAKMNDAIMENIRTMRESKSLSQLGMSGRSRSDRMDQLTNTMASPTQAQATAMRVLSS
jgi:hypothetical protein